MSEYPVFVFAALLILGYGLFSKLSEESVVTAPMVFMVLGLCGSFFRVDLLNGGIGAPVVKTIAEIALILVLFTDASTIDLKALRRDKSLPMRLLFIGLPITMALGSLAAWLIFPGSPAVVLLLIALILSPTDAALGQAVVTSSRVPERIRQTINVESGLNDGIALPPILICLAAVTAVLGSTSGVSYWVVFTLKQFVYGPLIGGLVGWLGGRLVDRASSRGWMNSTFQSLSALSIAILAFALAETVHGNGFIAAFFAGLMLGISTPAIKNRIHSFGEAESQAFVLFIFLLFGMVMIPLTYMYWDVRAWVYALLSLTAIRMLPVALSLMGTKIPWPSVWFIGWFGPRGIASILYLLLAVMELGTKGYERLISVVVLTVMLSILLHGLTAVPLSKLFRSGTPA